MEAYFGYNQIKIYPSDEDKTSFITNQGICSYRVMPSGLRNTEATYQMVNSMFKYLIRKTMEVYVDDVLVKILIEKDHVRHLKDTL